MNLPPAPSQAIEAEPPRNLGRGPTRKVLRAVRSAEMKARSAIRGMKEEALIMTNRFPCVCHGGLCLCGRESAPDPQAANHQAANAYMAQMIAAALQGLCANPSTMAMPHPVIASSATNLGLLTANRFMELLRQADRTDDKGNPI